MTSSDVENAYAATLASLFARVRFGERYGLDGPAALDRALGRPAARRRCVLVGGTNGKGSTSAFTEALLRAQGLKVGLFTSPHLNSFCERIRVAGEDVTRAQVIGLYARVAEAAARIGYEATFFECAWAMAAVTFDEADVDVVVWEVGLGGRLDATNVADPEVSAVVTVDLDHEDVLGRGHPRIAAEKAPIFRAGRIGVTAAVGDGLSALRETLAGWEVQSRPRLLVCGEDFEPVTWTLPLAGAHQGRNAAVACQVVEALGVRADVAALQTVRWPGRCERLRERLWVDCAHNVAGGKALAQWLATSEVGPVELVFGAMHDKDYVGVLSALLPGVARAVIVTPDHPRGAPAEVVRAHAAHLGASVQVEVAPSVRAALDAPFSAGIAARVVAGSCYLAAEARAAALGLEWPEAGLVTRAR